MCRGIYQAANTAKIRQRDGCGGPGNWGVFLDKDRALPGPSPTANLVGFWKDVIAWIMAAVAVYSDGI